MKATNDNPALGHSAEIESVYNQMLADLRSAIDDEYGSLAKFQVAAAAQGHKFELSNLYRVFSPKDAQRMSLELYVRLCAFIGVGGERMRGQRIGASNITLMDYLAIDNDVILKSFLQLQYRKASASSHKTTIGSATPIININTNAHAA